MTAGEILLRNGAEIFRVQDTMEKIAQAYGVTEFHVFVISNGIFASIGESDEGLSTQVRNVPISPVHLGRVAQVNDVSRRIAAGGYTPEQAMAHLQRIRVLPFAPPWLQVVSSGVGSASFCYILGGTPFDSAISFCSGILLWLFVLLANRHKLSKMLTNVTGSALVTLVGLTLFHFGMGDQMDKIITGSIIPLVPGVALTTGIRDLFNGDYLSGAIHMIDAVLIAACIAIGVGVVLRISYLIPGVSI